MPKRRQFTINLEADDRTIWQGMSADGLQRKLEELFRSEHVLRIYNIDVKEVDA